MGRLFWAEGAVYMKIYALVKNIAFLGNVAGLCGMHICLVVLVLVLADSATSRICTISS